MYSLNTPSFLFTSKKSNVKVKISHKQFQSVKNLPTIGLIYSLRPGDEKGLEQAGAEVGQAQLMLGLDFTLIFCRFGFTGYSLVELVWWILFCRFY